MADPSQSVEFACLDQLVFELVQGLGQPPGSIPGAAVTHGHSAIQDLLDSIPSIPETARTHILDQLAILTASAQKRFHPGLLPLLQDEHGFSNHASPFRTHGAEEICQEISPYLLHDTLILDLASTLEQQPISLLRSCAVSRHATLGHCFLLLVVADQASDELAHSLCSEALGVSDPQPIKAQLLGSPIWEFSQHGISHYIWIRSTRNLDGHPLADILNMLCCRAKIEYAVQHAADAYSRGLAHYQAIEARLAALPLKRATNAQERAQRIASFEEQLSFLPADSHGLARCERDLDSHLLLLADSQANARLSAARLPPTDTFLNSFFTDDCAIHLHQIQHNLKVLSPGRRYADQAIEAIRAMVSLDAQKLQMERQEQENNREKHSQKLQMERQEQENNREKRLRKDLAIVASGLSVSSIAASTRSRPTEKFLTHRVPHYAKSPYKPWPEILWLADIVILASLGLLSAFLVASFWDRLPLPRLLHYFSKRWQSHQCSAPRKLAGGQGVDAGQALGQRVPE